MGNLYYNHCGIYVDKFCILKQPPMARSDGHPLPFNLYLDGCIMLNFILPSSNFDTKLHEETNFSLMAYKTTTPKIDYVFHKLQP
jgi:hypothetical protein